MMASNTKTTQNCITTISPQGSTPSTTSSPCLFAVNNPTNSKNHARIIAGSVIGSIVGLVVILLLLWYYFRHRIDYTILRRFIRSKIGRHNDSEKESQNELKTNGVSDKDITDNPSNTGSNVTLMRTWRSVSIDKPLPPHPKVDDDGSPNGSPLDANSPTTDDSHTAHSLNSARRFRSFSNASLTRSSNVNRSQQNYADSLDSSRGAVLSSGSRKSKPFIPRLRTDSIVTERPEGPETPTGKVKDKNLYEGVSSPDSSTISRSDATSKTYQSALALPPLEKRTNLFSTELLGEFAPNFNISISSSSQSNNQSNSTPSTPSTGTVTPVKTPILSSDNTLASSMRPTHSSSTHHLPFRPTLSPIPSFTSPAIPPFPQESASSYSVYSRSDRFTPVTPIQRSINTSSDGLRMLDLVFVQDCTASQGPYIESAKMNIEQICQHISTSGKLLSEGLRVGLVAFRDHPPQDRTYVTKRFEFTSELFQMRANLSSLFAAGGGDRPEAVTAGLYEALNMNWRPNAIKMVILITDAPPHGLGEIDDGFDEGSPDNHDPLQIARAMASRGITLFAVTCEPTLSQTFHYANDLYHALTRLSSGLMLPLSNAALLSRVIIDSALENIDIERLIRENGVDAAAQLLETNESVDNVARSLQFRLQNEKVKEIVIKKIYEETAEAKHNVNTFMLALNLREARPLLKKVPVGARFTEEYKKKGGAVAEDFDDELKESSISSSQAERIAMQSAWRSLLSASKHSKLASLPT